MHHPRFGVKTLAGLASWLAPQVDYVLVNVIIPWGQSDITSHRQCSRSLAAMSQAHFMAVRNAKKLPA